MSLRFDAPLLGRRYCGNVSTKVVHDLDREVPGLFGCGIDEILEAGRATSFVPDMLEEAHNEGYKDCPKCIDPEWS